VTRARPVAHRACSCTSEGAGRSADAGDRVPPGVTQTTARLSRIPGERSALGLHALAVFGIIVDHEDRPRTNARHPRLGPAAQTGHRGRARPQRGGKGVSLTSR
jgi:hypothetical protein